MTNPNRDYEQSLGELVSRLSSETMALFQSHIALAKEELREEAKGLAITGSMWAVAGISGMLSLLLMSFAGAWALAEVVTTSLAFVIVGGVWLIVAVATAVIARNRMPGDLAPQATIEELQEDKRWLSQIR